MHDPRLIQALVRAFTETLLSAITAGSLDSHSFAPRFADSEPEQDRWLTAAEASRLTGLSQRWFYERARELPFAVRPSPRRLRFHHGQLMAWLKERQHGGKT